LEEDDDFTTVLNPVTKRETPALGDANMRNLRKGDVLQLERKGYYIVDVPYLRPQKAVLLIAIPDGRQVKDSKQAGTSKK
jgi:glutamyl-tRNA synthetase